MNELETRTYLREELDKQKQRSIQQAQEQLQQKKEEQKELEYLLLHADTDQAKRTYRFRIERNESARKKIVDRLKKLGIVEKRGRPKKEKGEHYQELRKKFTAHLQPETMDYLYSLKSTGSITHISSFLDELIAAHQKKNR